MRSVARGCVRLAPATIDEAEVRSWPKVLRSLTPPRIGEAVRDRAPGRRAVSALSRQSSTRPHDLVPRPYFPSSMSVAIAVTSSVAAARR